MVSILILSKYTGQCSDFYGCFHKPLALLTHHQTLLSSTIQVRSLYLTIFNYKIVHMYYIPFKNSFAGHETTYLSMHLVTIIIYCINYIIIRIYDKVLNDFGKSDDDMK